MAQKALSVLLILTLIAGNSQPSYSWGFFAHKRINRMAVMGLPTELMAFYKSNIEFITDHAVDPDKRRYAVEQEAARHYIDIDHYGKKPFENMPRRWKEAVAKYSQDTLEAYGIVPWHIDRMMFRLTKAFKEKDFNRILRYSSDLGHYIGDAHVPLHTTENYNGQLTNQKGIHGFWESRLPELMIDDYDFFVGKVEYYESPLDEAWEAVEASHAALDSVLRFEKELSQEYSGDLKFSFEQRGGISTRVYSREFSMAYHQRLDGMVERRMKAAIHCVASMWYTAWINAGRPDLLPLREKGMTDEMEKKIATDNKKYESGKIKGREHQQ
ncbi:MAG: zinc dependent phospholipase C family protein [Salibacteraceae bacterium]